MIAGRETASNALNVLQSARMAWCEVIGFSNPSAGWCFVQIHTTLHELIARWLSRGHGTAPRVYRDIRDHSIMYSVQV